MSRLVGGWLDPSLPIERLSHSCRIGAAGLVERLWWRNKSSRDVWSLNITTSRGDASINASITIVERLA